MKILVVGEFVWDIYEKSLFDSFQKMDIDVFSFKLKDYYLKHDNFLTSFSVKIQNKFLFGPMINNINKQLLKCVGQINPDLVFIYSAVHIFSETVVKIKQNSSIVFTYHNDDPFSEVPNKYYYRHYLNSSRFSDFNYVYRNKNINDFKLLGIKNTDILLPSYIPEKNYFIESKKKYDIGFIGHFEDDGRDLYIKALYDAGLDVSVFGKDDWKQSKVYDQIKSVIKPPKRGREYNLLLNEMKIALVFLSKINSDSYTRRCFEIPAVKVLIMSEFTDKMNDLFLSNKEAVYFSSASDLVEKCNLLLNNKQKLQSISFNGYKRLIKDGHSIDDRAHQILKKFYEISNI